MKKTEDGEAKFIRMICNMIGELGAIEADTELFYWTGDKDQAVLCR
jgi:hypothetical protein